MSPMLQSPVRRWTLKVAGAMVLALCAGGACKKKSAAGSADGKPSIQNIGSDTMVNLAQAWAEEYATVVPGVSVEVSGGGSGVGIAALIAKTADIANSSRHLEPEEEEKAKKSAGHAPTQFVVGYDGLAIYVHKSNPLDHISMEELAEVYKERGKINKWSDLGVTNIPGAKSDDIIRISRQNNSGTYHYFRETVVGKKNDFKAGSLDMNGSKDVVQQVSKTPGALGYSGVGYATPDVKILKVSMKKGEPGVVPSIATIHDKTYPISRPMFMFTPGEPAAHVKAYIDWVLSPAGQKIVEQTGYVPLAK
ncbi:MAG TPA: phosphate ABC transporter substrate-binding protein [Polyangiaceae bacterium]